MTTTSKPYRTWAARIESGTFTKAQVNAWCNRIVPCAEDGRNAGNLTETEADELVGLLKLRRGVGITEEHAQQGMTWAMRLPKRQREMFPDGYVEACAGSRVTYRFMGAEVARETAWRTDYTPRYLATFYRGDRLVSFCYSYVGWRSGIGGENGITITNVRD